MNYKEYINSKANDYKQYLLEDLKTNIRFRNVVDSLFFPLGFSIEKWLEETEVKSFHQHRFRGDSFFNRMCTRNEIDSIPSLNTGAIDFDRYTFFSYLKCDSVEDATKKTTGYYHFIQKDFYAKMDQIIFDRLGEYKRATDNIHFYSKRITSIIDLILCTEREHVDFQNIIGYSFPSLLININDEESIKFGKIDVRSLLFLPSDSFIFFYEDGHDFTIDGLRITGVTRKNDEPILHYFEEGQKYMITNSWENIDRYNKYIQIVLELSFHYFVVFEKWLTLLLKEERLKLV